MNKNILTRVTGLLKAESVSTRIHVRIALTACLLTARLNCAQLPGMAK